MNVITSHCHISKNAFSLNGKVMFTSDEPDIDVYLREVYKNLGLQYPKFHKMDRLCRLGFLAAEAILGDNAHVQNYPDDGVALFFANRNSSAETDKRFEHSYKTDGTPGPALFVYTLPNILIGEIAIRNKWYGENLFVIQPGFDPVFFENYCNILLSQSSKAVLCGWVNMDDEPHTHLFLVEKNKDGQGIELTAQNLQELYLKK